MDCKYEQWGFIWSCPLRYVKAFDLVYHELLLTKLSMYRVSEHSLMWFRSSLTYRQQTVQYKQSVPEPQHAMSSVPQDSILRPLLFIIFMNTWSWNRRTQSSICMLMTQQNVLKDILDEKLKTDTGKIVMWFDENGMATNISDISQATSKRAACL